MSLEKLMIIPLGDADIVEAQFNPNKISFSKSVNWAKQSPKGRDVPEVQFTNAEARTLSIELIFDTYDTDKVFKEDVQEKTDKLFALATVDSSLHRPPVCLLWWGDVGKWDGLLFQGVLEQLEQQFTLFTADGKPVRATSKCTFREWRTNREDLQRQNLQSADVAKKWLVKQGDSLSSIAAREYEDPRLWRAIADENDIDDPLALQPGTQLLVPSLTGRK